MYPAQRTGSSPAGDPIQPTRGPGDAEAVRRVELEPGQQVTATVLEASADGRVRIGMFGARIAAFSQLDLEVGKSYRFEVAAIEPRIVLTAARPMLVPGFSSASRAGLLGVPSQQLASQLIHLAEALPTAARPRSAAMKNFRARVEALSTGHTGPEDLRSLLIGMGHDQEARVLRLAKLSAERASAEVARLRQTIKAMVLEMIESFASEPRGVASRERAVRLLTGLNQIETRNARRSEQGVPLFLPLPIMPGSALLDVRLFVLPPPSDGDGGAEEAPNEREWSIILLLELSRLGAMRVDVRVRGDRVSADFQLVEHAPSLELRGALGQLEAELEDAGLAVQSLSLRHASASELPVADLVLPPPRSSDPAARVDLHV